MKEKHKNCPRCGRFMTKTDVWAALGTETPQGNLHKLWICYFCVEDCPRGD